MIVTITANPSLDRTYQVDSLQPGAVNRASLDTVEASGKGVNVSRVLTAAGVDTLAVTMAGGAEGEQLVRLLVAGAVPHRAHRATATTRTNVTVLGPTGVTTKVNAAGEPPSAADLDALLDLTAGCVAPGDWLVIAGTEPPGPYRLTERAIAVAHAAGARVAVDTSGSPLAAAHTAGADLLAPNNGELADLLGERASALPDPVDRAIADARTLIEGAALPALLVSLGEHGAIYAAGQAAWHAVAPSVVPVNTAGAGDALLAGFLGTGGDIPARLARAVAWGTAACQRPETAGDVSSADPTTVRVRTVTDPGKTDLDPSSDQQEAS
ncbi:MAG: 1-phosphofructokinase family hexose kinase [Jatrophihabitans sp.]